MDRIPVFVRAGAVLPTEEAGRDVLHLFPPDVGEPTERLVVPRRRRRVRAPGRHARSSSVTAPWTVDAHA